MGKSERIKRLKSAAMKTNQLNLLSVSVAKMNAELKLAGICYDEYQAFLNHAKKPALWEEDR